MKTSEKSDEIVWYSDKNLYTYMLQSDTVESIDSVSKPDQNVNEQGKKEGTVN